METKTCTKCETSHPIELFPVRDKSTGRRHSWCGQCLKTYKATRWATNKEAMKSYKKEWYEKNKEGQQAKSRLRYHTGDKTHHAETVWRNKLIREFGITQDQYELMLAEQHEVCKICGQKDNRRLAVDHCHDSGQVRGLLCRHCNTAIGLFDDDPYLLRKAADYLERRPNYRNLPVAIIDNNRLRCLANPDILKWDHAGDGKLEGRGLVWVGSDQPLKTLDPDTFQPTSVWGEVRMSQACVNGEYGPIMLDPAQEGDRVYRESTKDMDTKDKVELDWPQGDVVVS